MNRAVLVMVAGLCVTALTPLAAQQAVGVAPTAGVSPPPPVSSSNTAQSGPRLQPEFRRYEAPSVSDSSTAARVSTVNYSGGGVTVTLSTLALVLVVVIIVLLVAK